MVATVLANRKQICRLIVPKALLFQTAQILQAKIGGMVGRDVKHVRFSRRTPTNLDNISLYRHIHEKTLMSCGVILALPEHILSFKLSGQQRLADSRFKEARDMVHFQSWLTEKVHDVLDESDVTLAVKTQLIYPSGGQDSVDGHPARWETIENLLSLFEDHLEGLEADFPHSIEVIRRANGFPMVHFVQADVEDALHHRIADDICRGRVPSLRLTDMGAALKEDEAKRIFIDPVLERKRINRVCAFS